MFGNRKAGRAWKRQNLNLKHWNKLASARLFAGFGLCGDDVASFGFMLSERETTLNRHAPPEFVYSGIHTYETNTFGECFTFVVKAVVRERRTLPESDSDSLGRIFFSQMSMDDRQRAAPDLEGWTVDRHPYIHLTIYDDSELSQQLANLFSETKSCGGEGVTVSVVIDTPAFVYDEAQSVVQGDVTGASQLREYEADIRSFEFQSVIR